MDTGTSGETIRKSYVYMVYLRTQFEDVVVFSAFLNQPCYFEVGLSCDYASNVGVEGVVLLWSPDTLQQRNIRQYCLFSPTLEINLSMDKPDSPY